MKMLLKILGAMLIGGGVIFVLQGTNILPGSFMTGDPLWAINGALLAVAGMGLILWVNRRT